MKKYMNPEMEIKKYDVEDVITTSFEDVEDGGGWG